MYQIPLLCQLLIEAGFCEESATRITDALDAIDQPGCESDNVASVLFKWRTKHVRQRLGECRRKAASMFTSVGDRDAQKIATCIAMFQEAFNTEGELFPVSEGREAIA